MLPQQEPLLYQLAYSISREYRAEVGTLINKLNIDLISFKSQTYNK